MNRLNRITLPGAPTPETVREFCQKGALAYVPEKNSVYLFGGYNTKLSKYYSDLSFFSFSTYSWVPIQLTSVSVASIGWPKLELSVMAESPKSRTCCSLSFWKSHLFLFGGRSSFQLFNDLYIFDIDNCAWLAPKTTGTPPPPRCNHFAQVVGDKLYICGGIRDYESNYCYDMWVLDIPTLTWSNLRPTGRSPQPPNSQMSFGEAGGMLYDEFEKPKFYFFSGYSAKPFAILYIYDVEKDFWLEEESLPKISGVIPTTREGFSCVSSGKEILVYGGMGSPITAPSRQETNYQWQTYDSFFIFQGSGEWVELKIKDGPLSRCFSQIAVSPAGEVFIHGGSHFDQKGNAFTDLNDMFTVGLISTSNAAATIASLLDNKDRTDFTFQVANSQIYCNKFIFGRSPVLEALFSEKSVAKIERYSPDEFHAFLEFLYRDFVPDFRPSMKEALTKLAKEFEVPELEKYLQSENYLVPFSVTTEQNFGKNFDKSEDFRNTNNNNLDTNNITNKQSESLTDVTTENLNEKKFSQHETINQDNSNSSLVSAQTYISSLLKSSKFSDITFQVEGKEFPAHKHILMVQSGYFNLMFSGTMRESTSRKVEIKETSAVAFELCLRYLYNDPPDFATVSADDVVELMLLAHQLELGQLFRNVQLFLANNLSADNVMAVFQGAEYLALESLAVFCVDFVAHFFVGKSKSSLNELEGAGPDFVNRVRARIIKLEEEMPKQPKSTPRTSMKKQPDCVLM